MRDSIVERMVSNNLFHPAQHGFIAGSSCVTQLLEVMEGIIKDNGDDVDITYLYFIKMFDKVPHQRLITKMNGYGIKGCVLNWVRDFLRDRQQRVAFNGVQSDWKKYHK